MRDLKFHLDQYDMVLPDSGTNCKVKEEGGMASLVVFVVPSAVVLRVIAE
jgi:hypothetical protein